MNDWIPISNGPPDPGVPVLVVVRNENGLTRRLRAQYSDGKSLPVSEDGFDLAGWAVYDERADEYWCPEGWFETNEFEDTHWQITDPVSHWMPLPKLPEDVDE
jgi:hypothetical protein